MGIVKLVKKKNTFITYSTNVHHLPLCCLCLDSFVLSHQRLSSHVHPSSQLSSFTSVDQPPLSKFMRSISFAPSGLQNHPPSPLFPETQPLHFALCGPHNPSSATLKLNHLTCTGLNSHKGEGQRKKVEWRLSRMLIHSKGIKFREDTRLRNTWQQSM